MRAGGPPSGYCNLGTNQTGKALFHAKDTSEDCSGAGTVRTPLDQRSRIFLETHGRSIWAEGICISAEFIHEYNTSLRRWAASAVRLRRLGFRYSGVQ